MACSAVVIELPNGVFITMMPFAVAAGMSTLSTPMPARPITLRRSARSMSFLRDLGGGAHREPVEVADDGGELVLVLAEVRLEVDLDAAVLENLDRRRGKRIGDENARSHDVCLSKSCAAPNEGSISRGSMKLQMRVVKFQAESSPRSAFYFPSPACGGRIGEGARSTARSCGRAPSLTLPRTQGRGRESSYWREHPFTPLWAARPWSWRRPSRATA